MTALSASIKWPLGQISPRKLDITEGLFDLEMSGIPRTDASLEGEGVLEPRIFRERSHEDFEENALRLPLFVCDKDPAVTGHIASAKKFPTSVLG